MGKGRDKELIKLRDEALCRRYYYWTEIQRLLAIFWIERTLTSRTM